MVARNFPEKNKTKKFDSKEALDNLMKVRALPPQANVNAVGATSRYKGPQAPYGPQRQRTPVPGNTSAKPALSESPGNRYGIKSKAEFAKSPLMKRFNKLDSKYSANVGKLNTPAGMKPALSAKPGNRYGIKSKADFDKSVLMRRFKKLGGK